MTLRSSELQPWRLRIPKTARSGVSLGVILVGEGIANDQSVLKVIQNMSEGKVFRAFNSRNALKILSEHPEIRLVIVGPFSYAILYLWIRFVKNLFPSVKVIACCNRQAKNIAAADGWLPDSPTQTEVKTLVTAMLQHDQGLT